MIYNCPFAEGVIYMGRKVLEHLPVFLNGRL